MKEKKIKRNNKTKYLLITPCVNVNNLNKVIEFNITK